MLSILFLIAAILTMACGAIALYVLRDQGATRTVRRWSETTSWIALCFGVLFGLQIVFRYAPASNEVFSFTLLQAIVVPYILMMGILVKRFAYHYLQSDLAYAKFFLKIKLLIAALLIVVVSNHALALAFSWMASGWIMYSLISHTGTNAAKQSGKLALGTFIVGDLFLLAGIFGLASQTNCFDLQTWLTSPSVAMLPWLFCIVIAAFSKTSIMPLHQWLTHSINAPTPVSAIMHAGFVNSGAVLLAKLSILVVQAPVVMTVVFIVGLVSALVGSLAMLVQTDVKRYLTFSTVGQMGFMMMECGLGAFHLAILHLMVHGFFKARLFLSSGTVIEQRQAVCNVNHKLAARMADKQTVWALPLNALVFSVATWFLLLQIPSVRAHLLELPLLLLMVLGLSTLFVHTVVFKSIGIGLKGTSFGMLLSGALVLLYILYEAIAQAFFPDLNLFHYTAYMPLYNLSGLLLAVFGILVWLFQLNVLVVPASVRNMSYVFLLNLAGTVKFGRTFFNRSYPTSVESV